MRSRSRPTLSWREAWGFTNKLQGLFLRGRSFFCSRTLSHGSGEKRRAPFTSCQKSAYYSVTGVVPTTDQHGNLLGELVASGSVKGWESVVYSEYIQLSSSVRGDHCNEFPSRKLSPCAGFFCSSSSAKHSGEKGDSDCPNNDGYCVLCSAANLPGLLEKSEKRMGNVKVFLQGGKNRRLVIICPPQVERDVVQLVAREATYKHPLHYSPPAPPFCSSSCESICFPSDNFAVRKRRQSHERSRGLAETISLDDKGWTLAVGGTCTELTYCCCSTESQDTTSQRAYNYVHKCKERDEGLSWFLPFLYKINLGKLMPMTSTWYL